MRDTHASGQDLPLIRALDDSLVCCPDPDERLVMRVERIGERTLRTEDLT